MKCFSLFALICGALTLISCQREQFGTIIAPCPMDPDSTIVMRADYTDLSGNTQCLSAITLRPEATNLQAPLYANSLQLDPYRDMYFALNFPFTGDEDLPFFDKGFRILIKNTALDPPEPPFGPSVPEVFLTPELILERLLFPGTHSDQRRFQISMSVDGFSGYTYFGSEVAPPTGDFYILESRLSTASDGQRYFDLVIAFNNLTLQQWYIPTDQVNLDNGRIQVSLPVAWFIPE